MRHRQQGSITPGDGTRPSGRAPLRPTASTTHNPTTPLDTFHLLLSTNSHTQWIEKRGPVSTTVTSASLDILAGRLPESQTMDHRNYLARTLSEQFREVFFANSVLLTEGPSDAAVFEAAASLLGLESLPASGVVVTNVGGKGSQPIALAILDALAIPTYCVFDGDASLDRWRRMRDMRKSQARPHFGSRSQP